MYTGVELDVPARGPSRSGASNEVMSIVVPRIDNLVPVILLKSQLSFTPNWVPVEGGLGPTDGNGAGDGRPDGSPPE